MPKSPKSSAGRPTAYKDIFADQARKLTRDNKTEKYIAEFFGVSERTLARWKNKYPDFGQALKEARDEKLSEVEASLFARATGYSHPEEKLFFDKRTGEVVRAMTTKHYPPDVGAQAFILKCQAGWRENAPMEGWQGDVSVNITYVSSPEPTEEDTPPQFREIVAKVDSGLH